MTLVGLQSAFLISSFLPSPSPLTLLIFDDISEGKEGEGLVIHEFYWVLIPSHPVLTFQSFHQINPYRPQCLHSPVWILRFVASIQIREELLQESREPVLDNRLPDTPH